MSALDLELCRLGCAREGYHVAYVLHAGDEQYESLEAETEAGVRARTVLARVEIPCHVLHWDVAFLYLVHQFVVALLAHRAADNLANLREQHVGALHRLAALASEARLLVVYLHVERLDGLRVVGHDDRPLEVLLHEVALML